MSGTIVIEGWVLWFATCLCMLLGIVMGMILTNQQRQFYEEAQRNMRKKIEMSRRKAWSDGFDACWTSFGQQRKRLNMWMQNHKLDDEELKRFFNGWMNLEDDIYDADQTEHRTPDQGTSGFHEK